MEVKFRTLEINDAEQFRNVRLKSYQESPFAFSESYEDEKNQPLNKFEEELIVRGAPPEWFVLGAFVEKEQLIGFVKFRRDLRSKGRHKAMIHAMYIDKNYRNLGIGKKILLELFEMASLLIGLEQIHLWVLHSAVSTSASGFYSNLGFLSQGIVKKDLLIQDTYVDAEYMVLYL